MNVLVLSYLQYVGLINLYYWSKHLNKLILFVSVQLWMQVNINAEQLPLLKLWEYRSDLDQSQIINYK